MKHKDNIKFLIIDVYRKYCYMMFEHKHHISISMDEMINKLNNEKMETIKVPIVFGELHLLPAFLKDCEVNNIAVNYNMPAHKDIKHYITFGNAVLTDKKAYLKYDSVSKFIAIYNYQINISELNATMIFNLPDEWNAAKNYIKECSIYNKNKEVLKVGSNIECWIENEQDTFFTTKRGKKIKFEELDNIYHNINNISLVTLGGYRLTDIIDMKLKYGCEILTKEEIYFLWNYLNNHINNIKK